MKTLGSKTAHSFFPLLLFVLATFFLAGVASAGPYENGHAQGSKAGQTDGYKAGYEKHSKDAYLKKFQTAFLFAPPPGGFSEAQKNKMQYDAGFKAGYVKAFNAYYALGRKQGIEDGEAQAQKEIDQINKMREKLRKELEAKCNSGGC